MKKTARDLLYALTAFAALGTLAGGCSGSPASSKTAPPPLLRAVAQGDLAATRSLLDQGADPNAEAGEGDRRLTPLLVAIALDRPEIARVLIRAGARSGPLHLGFSARDLAYYLEQDSLAAAMEGN